MRHRLFAARVLLLRCFAITLCLSSTAALAQALPDNPSGGSAPPTYSMVPSAPSDVYVAGKYNRAGAYVPPHYEPKRKPVFHGYFDSRKTTFKNGFFNTPKTKPKVQSDGSYPDPIATGSNSQ